MTTAASTLKRNKFRERSRDISLSPMDFVLLVLAVLMIAAYVLLPWANQPELGNLTVSAMTASRDSNPLELPTEGLLMIPVGAAIALLVGLWNLVSPKQGRSVAALGIIAGLSALLPYAIFFMELGEAESDWLGAMSMGFWAILAIAVAMVLQVVLPRIKIEGFEVRRSLGNQETVLGLVLIFMIISVGIANPRFVLERNLYDILLGNAYIAVAAIGMSMVIISGNIDISVGSLIGVLAVLSGRMAVAGWPVWLAWLAPLLVGALIGAFIGWLVAYLRIPSIVVTLGMLSILKGGLIIVTNGERVTDIPTDFFLAQMKPLGIPMPVYFMVILTILAAIWMRNSSLGRSMYAVGGNAEAARLSGISKNRVVVQVFAINGIFVGIASVLYATQLTIIQATPAAGLELFVITSAVVGGVSILGGTGTVIGAMLAAILLNTIRSAMIFINVSPFWLQAVQGLLILVTVLVDLLRRRRQLI